MSERRHHGTDSSAPDWDALGRHLAGETTPEEAAAIEAALEGQPEERALLSTLDGAIASMRVGNPEDLDVESALRGVNARRRASDDPEAVERRHDIPATRRIWRTPFPAIAAVGLFAIGIGSWLTLRENTAPAVVGDMPGTPGMLATGVGVRDSMRLPDGTQVILGPLSSIRLAADYGTTARNVEIRGDAWFDVTHDSSKPFTVRAGGAAVLDIGTKFAIRTDSLKGVSVTVTEGSVSLRASNTPATSGVVLQAGDNGLLRVDGEIVPLKGTATPDDLAWLQGRLVFRDASMEEVAASMRRWYGIQLRVADPSLKDRHMTATLDGESADVALEILRLALGATIHRSGDTAIIRRR